MRASVLALILGACTCPQVPCGATLVVPLRVDAWQTGSWSLTVVDGDDAWLSCTITVPVGDVPPTLLDLDCNDRVERAAFVSDTGLTQDPSLLEFEAARQTEALPDTLTVRLTRDAQVLVDDRVVDVVWRPVARQSFACLDTCRTARLPVSP